MIIVNEKNQIIRLIIFEFKSKQKNDDIKSINDNLLIVNESNVIKLKKNLLNLKRKKKKCVKAMSLICYV